MEFSCAMCIIYTLLYMLIYGKHRVSLFRQFFYSLYFLDGLSVVSHHISYLGECGIVNDFMNAINTRVSLNVFYPSR
jgi:hypothetical protein